MAKAKIVFVPVSGDTTAAWGVTNERGHYRLLHKSGIPGVSIGEYKVAISPLLDPEMLLAAPDETRQRIERRRTGKSSG